jgi:hypothetical protein
LALFSRSNCHLPSKVKFAVRNIRRRSHHLHGVPLLYSSGSTYRQRWHRVNFGVCLSLAVCATTGIGTSIAITSTTGIVIVIASNCQN